MKPRGIFQADGLPKKGNGTQVQTLLAALEGLTRTKGFHTTIDVAAKYAEKQGVLMKAS